MSAPYYIGKCFLCGAEDEILNEGICGKHSNEVAQAYLFGFADGKNSAEAPTVEPDATPDRSALREALEKIKAILGASGPTMEGDLDKGTEAFLIADEALEAALTPTSSKEKA